MRQITLALLLSGIFTVYSAGAKEESLLVHPPGKKGAEVRLWLETSLKRVFPNSQPGSTNLSLLAARNSKIAFQVCARNFQTEELHLDCKVIGVDDLTPQVRFVGMVPVHHHTRDTEISELDGTNEIPGLVPDPLWPMTKVHFGPYESRSYWVTLNIPAGIKPGLREFTVQIGATNGTSMTNGIVAELSVKLEISDFVIKPRKDFPVTHWWRGEATWDYYKTEMFDQRWWQITRWQLENMLAHGSDVVYVPMFFSRRETFKRPCQLLIANEPTTGKYEFDWAQVKQFTDMCREIGFTKFEWPHMWIYWGVKNPMRIYTKKGENYEMLWKPDISGFSETYTNFLGQFLPQFHDFLTKEKMLESSYFHLSDEPSAAHLADYKHARQILRDLAPWMKVMDALSNIEYGKQGLTDMPIPLVSSAQAYVDAKIPHWVYYCVSPRGPWLNRFVDMPLPKIRMNGWLFYRMGAKGFLHWGFNYWHKLEEEKLIDPFNDLTAAQRVSPGDPFMIYPGADGHPMDSLRWEIFAESLQDYAILQTAGIDPQDPLLSDIKTYGEFPKNEEWINKTLEKILRTPAQPKKEAGK